MVKLETAEWGQGDPFNNKCPLLDGTRCLTGCVATAYAILMKYYGYPTTARNHNYDWDSMPLKYDEGQYSDKAVRQVSTLMADIGTAMQLKYGIDNTTGSLGRNELYSLFDYNPGIEDRKERFAASAWYAKLRDELDQSHPIIYRATNENEDGHAFIIDGYTDNDYFSVNWGWKGYCNGFYALDALQSEKEDYRTNQSAYFNCLPMPLCQGLDVVEMNGTTFPSLKTAIAAAPANGTKSTITLLSNIEQQDFVYIEPGKDIVLNLNGKEIIQADVLENYGTLCISAENGGCISKIFGNRAILENYGSLTIEGGTFFSQVPTGSDYNYARCIWTEEGSTTLIQGGSFTSYAQNVCFNGEATIEDGRFLSLDHYPNVGCCGAVNVLGGEYESQGSVLYLYDNDNDVTVSGGTFTSFGNHGVITSYNKSGRLIITGGTVANIAPTPDGSDYRRAVWTEAGTNTIIRGGTFTAPTIVVCGNGDVTIQDGSFTCTGNSSVISNYNTHNWVTITGGTFTNECPTPSGTDYRRAVWTAENTKTLIRGGTFSAPMQVLCFNGNAIIFDGTMTNTGSGYGILVASNSTVALLGCKLKAPYLLYEKPGSTLACEGGLYSQMVDSELIPEGFVCIDNTDSETSFEYPYAVVSTSGTGIAETWGEKQEDGPAYNLSGQRVNGNSPGIVIQNGRKILRNR